MTFITRETVAEKFSAYLHYDLSLDSLVAWAESALMEGEFDPAHLPTIRDVVARIGVADVRAFGLTWEGCGAPRQTAVLLGDSLAIPRRSVSSHTKTSDATSHAFLHGSILRRRLLRKDGQQRLPAEASEQLLAQPATLHKSASLLGSFHGSFRSCKETMPIGKACRWGDGDMESVDK